MALTPERIAELERLKAMMRPLATDAQRKAQAIFNAEKAAGTPVRLPTDKAKGGFVNDKHKKWFGNSKVTNDKKMPLDVYHATEGNHTKFEPAHKIIEQEAHPHELHGSGTIAQMYKEAKQKPELHFFAADPDVASTYGSNLIKAHLKVKNLVGHPDMSRDEAIALMLSKNADGAMFKETDSGGHYGGTGYVVRSGHQIKSPDQNQGSFDPTNPDITKAKGGNVSVDAMRLALAKGGSITHAHHLEIEERPL